MDRGAQTKLMPETTEAILATLEAGNTPPKSATFCSFCRQNFTLHPSHFSASLLPPPFDPPPPKKIFPPARSLVERGNILE